MRVIHVTPTAFGTAGLFGGGERYPLELARALSRYVKTELITFGSIPSVRDEDGLRIRVLRSRGYLRGHPAGAIVPSLPRAIRHADIVHVHHIRSPASLLAAATARLCRISTAGTDHGFEGVDLGLGPRLIDRFLAVSRYSATVMRTPVATTRVIYGGADPSRHYPDLDVQRSGVLFVGRQTPHKGIDVLIRALPGAARLTVAGSEGHDPQLPERGYPELLRSLAQGRSVEFTGAVDDDELARLYRSATAVAMPSVEHTWYGKRIAVSELLGLAAIEAMASGTPVVASRIGGLAEVIEDGVTGYLVPPGDVHSLHERLRELLANPALAARLGANAREHVLAEMTWDRCAQRCLAAYDELRGGSR